MLKRIFLISALLISFSTYSAEKYLLDPNHSYVQWHIKHLGFSTQSGKWFAKGFIWFDKDKIQDSKVEASIDLANMVTGNKELDTHLKGEEFFDVKKFPVAKFVSQKVTPIGKKRARISGVLTIHGVSKPVTLEATFNKAGINPITNKKTMGFSATATLQRSAFGISTLIPQLDDEVTLSIEAEAYQDSKEPAHAS